MPFDLVTILGIMPGVDRSYLAQMLLVGAGGHFCPVARWAGARRDRRASVVAAQEIEFEADPEELRRGAKPDVAFLGKLA